MHFCLTFFGEVKISPATFLQPSIKKVGPKGGFQIDFLVAGAGFEPDLQIVSLVRLDPVMVSELIKGIGKQRPKSLN